MSRCIAGLLLAAAAVFAALPASAGVSPRFEPPPPWVQTADMPKAPDPDGAAAIQVVLDDNQTRLSPEGDAYYNRRVFKVLKPEGLTAFKTQAFTWSPDIEDISIHALDIIRDGRRIDLLEGGTGMEVMRRETNLERSMLDGRLTVSRQIVGLETGDMVEVAFTTTRRDPVLKGRSQDYEKLTFPGLVGRYRARVLWPSDAPVKWRATSGYPAATESDSGGLHEIRFDASGIRAPQPPAGAPLRFRRQGELEVTSFRGWADVSRLMAPLYASAAPLGKDSPLRAEAARIKAAHPDAAGRAFAALALVESQTRYLFLGMNDGGYVPAPADLTWTRRFGDCKGKTVLLLALLKELGIKAEPALVSIGAGDGLDERLPSIAPFNHVLVRAEVDGRTYWLDGTRTGDASGLEALRPPGWRWALPVRAEGADLTPIPQPPLDKPEMETRVRLDASQGLEARAPALVEMRMTGDSAIAFREGLARTAREDAVRGMRQNFSKAWSWIEIGDIDWKDDPAANVLVLTLKGQAEMDWRRNPDVDRREFHLPDPGAAAGFTRREPGPDRDAPYVVAYPVYTRATMEVVLPDGGRGFTVRGPTDTQEVGGYQLVRSATVVGGVASFVAEVRSLRGEISAAEAETANRTLRQIAADERFVRAPS